MPIERNSARSNEPRPSSAGTLAHEDKSREPPAHDAALNREQQIKASVRSLLSHCSQTKNPALAFSRACSKVGFMARDGVRDNLFYLESALNEQKHALLQQRLGAGPQVRQHIAYRDEALRAFGRSVQREVLHPKQPPSTPELSARIDHNLHRGDWNRAQIDLDQLARRADIGTSLKSLDEYPRAWKLPDEQFASLGAKIQRCNASARQQELQRGRESQAREAPHPRASERETSVQPSPRLAPRTSASNGSRIRNTQFQPNKDRGLDR